MRMSQKDSVNCGRRYRKRVPVSFSKLPFLVESTINEQTGTVGEQEMSGTSNVLSGAEKLQLYLHILPQR
jgi:hypothetical protein